VAADDTGLRPVARTTRLRLLWLGIVVAIMALLTAGWPLLNTAVSNRQPLAAGSRLTVGTGTASSAVVTVGAGWYMLPAQTNPAQAYMLSKGALQLAIMHVSLVGPGQEAQTWAGMRRILAVTYPGARISRAASIDTRHGVRALKGAMISRRLVGTVTIFPGPSGLFAIGTVVLAPRTTNSALRAAAARVVYSLMFAAHSP
jgi:hypothetical protein